jgi:hypothetical protein
MYYILAALLITAPGIALAQTGSVQALLGGLGDFINSILIPLLLGIAFLFFVINAVRFFVIGGSSDEGQERAKNLALYGIATFVFILSFWGIVNVLAGGIGISGTDPCTSNLYPDYFERRTSAPCPRSAPSNSGGSGNVTGGGTATGGSGVGTNGSGNVALGTPGAYKPVTEALSAIRTKATVFFSSHDYQAIYGSNKTVVQNMLFADLGATSQSNTVTEAERVKAAYRLFRAGGITQNEYNTYFTAVNTYYDAMYQPQNKVSAPSVTSITINEPAVVVAGVNASKAAVQNRLEAYNIMNTNTVVNIPNTLATLYNPTITPTTRWSNFRALYDSSDGQITDPDFHIFNTYRDNLNTENAFAGNFIPIW